MKRSLKLLFALGFTGLVVTSSTFVFQRSYRPEGGRAAVMGNMGENQFLHTEGIYVQKRPSLHVVLDHETSLNKECVLEIASKLVNLVETKDLTDHFEEKLENPSKNGELYTSFRRIIVFTFASKMDKVVNAKILRAIPGVVSVEDLDGASGFAAMVTPNDPKYQYQ